MLICIDTLSEEDTLIVVQSLSGVWFFTTPWTAAHQASQYVIIFQSLLKLMSTESVMPSNHLILCCPLLPLTSIFPSIRVFSTELAFHIRWPKYWSFSFSTSPSNEHSGLFFRLNTKFYFAIYLNHFAFILKQIQNSSLIFILHFPEL